MKFGDTGLSRRVLATDEIQEAQRTIGFSECGNLGALGIEQRARISLVRGGQDVADSCPVKQWRPPRVRHGTLSSLIPLPARPFRQMLSG
jgi:hypothetical protein